MPSRSSRSIPAPGNSGGFGKMAHLALTLRGPDVEGQQAYQARERVVQFLEGVTV